VLELRQQLPFTLEMSAHALAAETAHQLDRDLLHELAVGALTEQDDAHAALAELAQNAIGADACRQTRCVECVHRAGDGGGCWVARGFGQREQLLDLARQRRLRTSERSELQRALSGREIGQFIVERAQAPNAFGAAISAHLVSCPRDICALMALRGAHADAEVYGDVGRRHAAEIAEFDHLGRAQPGRGEALERRAQRQRSLVITERDRLIVERDALPVTTALLGAVPARVIDQHRLHLQCRECEGITARLPVALATRQPHDGLVHQRGRIERDWRAIGLDPGARHCCSRLVIASDSSTTLRSRRYAQARVSVCAALSADSADNTRSDAGPSRPT
jgi:hypothetical protein